MSTKMNKSNRDENNNKPTKQVDKPVSEGD